MELSQDQKNSLDILTNVIKAMADTLMPIRFHPACANQMWIKLDECIMWAEKGIRCANPPLEPVPTQNVDDSLACEPALESVA